MALLFIHFLPFLTGPTLNISDKNQINKEIRQDKKRKDSFSSAPNYSLLCAFSAKLLPFGNEKKSKLSFCISLIYS